MPPIQNAVVVLLDSLNRHLLGCYGGGEFDTPNLDRLAQRGVRFTRNYAGSLPCIPARHDLLCGNMDFLWKPWGSIELWERPITFYLRKAGIVTQLISDHPHLFEAGGENYHTDFYAWDYQRGHESDPWKTKLDQTMVGTPSYHRPADYEYHRNRAYFREEADYPGPKVMAAAADWLEENAGAHDRFLLFVDEFDPHEPFDTPAPFNRMYDPDWTEAPRIWPPYLLGKLDDREARQIRAQYGGKLTMIDQWLGRVIDAMDKNALWDSTLFLLVTDHGHYLGEHDCWGKPPAPIYDTLGHTPMIACAPGASAGTTNDALTTNVDVAATLLDLFGIARTRQPRHGRSLLPLLDGSATSVREYLVQGYWGQRISVVDADQKYVRGVREPEALAIYSNRWSTMPPVRLPDPDERATLGPYMPWSEIPVIRQPMDRRAIDRLIWTIGDHTGDFVFDVHEDPAEERNLAGDTKREKRGIDLLRAALEDLAAPKEQYRRLGIS